MLLSAKRTKFCRISYNPVFEHSSVILNSSYSLTIHRFIEIGPTFSCEQCIGDSKFKDIHFGCSDA